MPELADRASAAIAMPLRPITWRSALKRAALGIVILAICMGGVAWLTYASIDPDADGSGQAKAGKPDPAMQEVRL